MPKRKLTEKKEQEVALMKLCGVKNDYISTVFSISVPLIDSILRERSHQWGHFLVEFYRQRPKTKNAAHLYLSFQGRAVPHRHWVDVREHSTVWCGVWYGNYLPQLESIGERLSLRRLSKPRTGAEGLINSLFEYADERIRTALQLTLTEQLSREYSRVCDSKEELGDIWSKVEQVFVDRIRLGGLSIDREVSPKKFEILQKVLGLLKEDERRVVELEYGLADGRERTVKEIAREGNMTTEHVNVLRFQARRKLTDPGLLYNLRPLIYFATDLEAQPQLDLLNRVERMK